MKEIKQKLALCILLLFIVTYGISQNVTLSSKSGKYRLGFNIGSFYQESDVEKLPGFGYGLTFERRLIPQSTSFFSFSLRSRYLHGISEGLDYTNFLGIKNNTALNGTRNSQMNYYDISDSFYFYNNYQTKVNDFSGELMIYFNELWQKTNILLYGWGGFSLARYQAKIDQIAQNGFKYDYSLIQAGNKEFVHSQLTNILDGKYESWADELTKKQFTYGPSAGIGLGYQITKRVSIGIEHKVTWTNTDLLDGQQWDMNNQPSLEDDIYHYTVLGLKILFGGSDEPDSKPKNPDVIKTEDNKKPVIEISTPIENPYSRPDCKVYILGKIKNITSIEQIIVKENSNSLKRTEFFFTPETGVFRIERQIDGNTEYQIIATNAYGTATRSQTILCSGLPKKPQITIEEPKVSPFKTESCLANIVAYIPNVKGKEFITVTENGSPLLASDYTFNTYNRLIIGKAIKDYSVFVITARNEIGITTAEVIIDCRKQSEKPSVKITQPSVSPFTAPDCKADIRATTTAIKNKNQIIITENGNPLAPSLFSFDPASGQIKLTKSLGINTSNTYLIKVQNETGEASAQVNIQCKEIKKIPVVNITEPFDDPYQSSDCKAYIVAGISNIDNINQITIRENGIIISSSFYSFDTYSKTLKINKNISGDAVFQIEARNEAGNGSGSITIKCVKVTPVYPKITLIEPSVSPYRVSDCRINIKAMVENVIRMEDISVTENGYSINGYWTYNTQTRLLTITKEISGTSVFEIVAVNNFGNDKKSTTILCEKKINQPSVIFTFPDINPFITSDCKVNIRAKTTNVNTKSQIIVKDNGNLIPSTVFNFDPATGIVSFTRDIAQKSTIEIKVTTASGTATTSTLIECRIAKLPPEITITEPSGSIITISDCNAKVKAIVKNVESRSEITVIENGFNLASNYWLFDPTTGILTINKTIGAESKFEIIASTLAGKSTKSVVVKCQSEVKLPTVQIAFPSVNPYITSACNVNVKAVTANVSSKSQIMVKDNGSIIPSNLFNFDPATGVITFTRNINQVSNIEIKVTTPSGTAAASTQIECKVAKLPPDVTITEPSGSSTVITDCNARVKAIVKNVEGKSEITIKENGQILPSANWLFEASSGVVTINKNISGESKFEITANTSAGSSSKSVTIKCQPEIKTPTVNIVFPNQNPYKSTVCQLSMRAVTTNVDNKNQIVIKNNSVVVGSNDYSFDPVNGIINFGLDINEKSIIEIKVNTATGSAVTSIVIECPKKIIPPTVTITEPAVSPYVSPDCMINLKAIIRNIENRNQIVVKENGVILATSLWTFDAASGILTMKKAFSGEVNIEISANNTAGNAVGKTVFRCEPKIEGPKVSIISPTTSPFITTDCMANIKAKATNIVLKTQIKVTENGSDIGQNAFSFDMTTQTITISKKITGTSEFIISASNEGGVSSAKVSIQCQPQKFIPTVKIIQPATSPYASTSCNIAIKAQTTFIESKNDIVIKEGANVLGDNEYDFDKLSQEITINRTISGVVVYAIRVKNAYGEASVSQSISCVPPVLPPVITILQPKISPHTTYDCIADIKAVISNVKNKSGLKVFNGTVQLNATEYTFDTISGAFSMKKTLPQSNTIKITASNRAGTVSKDIIINCVPKPVPPEVVIIEPETEEKTVWPCNAYVVAKTKGITEKSQITVYKNGNILDAMYFVYSPETDEITIDFGLDGQTIFKIVVTNANGSANDSVTFKCAAP